MSFSICRIAKIKSNGVTGIQLHDKREKNISHTNKDIDWSTTHENIDLLNQQKKFRTIVKEKIDALNLKRSVRKDATVMAQCLITSDTSFFNNLTKQEQVDFFTDSYEFIKDKYGEENMVSAIIHFDEKTPHIHINFVPIVDNSRLSARDLFSPKKLRQLQNDFNNYINQKGYDLERGKINSKKKHLRVEEYKLKTRFNDLKIKKLEIDKRIKELLDERDAVKNDLDTLKSDLRSACSTKAHIDNIDVLNGKLGTFNKKKITISTDEFENLKSLSKKYYILKNNINDLENKNSNLISKTNTYVSENNRLQYKYFETNKKLKNISKQLKIINTYLQDNGLVNDFINYKEQVKQNSKRKVQQFNLER